MTTEVAKGGDERNQASHNSEQSETKKSTNQKDLLHLLIDEIPAPQKPQPSKELLAQLAAFRSSDNAKKHPESLHQLTSSLKSKQALQASALVGRKVWVQSNKMHLQGEGACRLAVDLPEAQEKLTLLIYSTGKELLKTIDMAIQSAGFFEFAWDGIAESGERLPAGVYLMEAYATAEEQEVVLKTMTAANVNSVSLNASGGVKLHIAGHGALALQEVKQVSDSTA